MDLKHLLSLVTAALTALGAILYAMGSQHTAFAVVLWVASLASLVVTDFLAVLRMPRNVGLFLMWVALAVFLPQFLMQALWHGQASLTQSPDWQLRTVANILICLQCTLLFQEKDARTYGWLILMSLLQVVVAARYSRGVAFGSLLIAYGAIGTLGLSLLTLYARRGRLEREDDKSRTRHAPRDERRNVERDASKPAGRWPLAGIEAGFTSTPAGSGRSGVVPEFFGRLLLIIFGAVLLAAMIFYTVPRPRINSWRMGENKGVALVGFNDRIELGGLGETIENRQEVMRLRLFDAATREAYPLPNNEIYLRGTEVNWYSQNHWRRQAEGQWSIDELKDESRPIFQIGSPVIQQATMEPYVDRDELFYVWPLVGARNDWRQRIQYEGQSEHLTRIPDVNGEPRARPFSFEVRTTGLVDGEQVALVPARRDFNISPRSPLLEIPESGLPRLTALAERWRADAGLKPEQQYDIAKHFEQQLSSSGQFHYSLQGQPRDESIDAIEDFVSKHPVGHCEYFATALALMLRSQGIPSRVVLGYRCDEWDPNAQCFQVRQLHAHAWVEAFLSRKQVPASLRRQNPLRWSYGGWLRLDGTPADDLGTIAANHTAWGTLQAKLHGLQHYWESYIADMDHAKQQESVYEPIRRTIHNFASGLVSPAAWRKLFGRLWATLARAFGSGIIGKLVGAVLLAAVAGLLALVAWWMARLGIWLWRRIVGRGDPSAKRARSSVEFYHRFEQLLARYGLLRSAGQTPREFACTAGAELATLSGRPELCELATQVAEAFYRVRFGKQSLDATATQAVQAALEELKQGAEGPRPTAAP